MGQGVRQERPQAVRRDDMNTAEKNGDAAGVAESPTTEGEAASHAADTSTKIEMTKDSTMNTKFILNKQLTRYINTASIESIEAIRSNSPVVVLKDGTTVEISEDTLDGLIDTPEIVPASSSDVALVATSFGDGDALFVQQKIVAWKISGDSSMPVLAGMGACEEDEIWQINSDGSVSKLDFLEGNWFATVEEFKADFIARRCKKGGK